MSSLNFSMVATHKVEDLDGIEVIKTSAALASPNAYVYTSRIWPFKARFSAVPSLLVGMAARGYVRGRFSIRNTLSQLSLAPGSVFVIPPNTTFDAEIESNAEIIQIYVSDRLFKNIEQEFLAASEGLFNLGSRFSISDQFLTQTILSIKEIVERGGTFARIELEYLTRVLTARLIAKYSNSGQEEHVGEGSLPPSILRDVIDFIDNNISRRITVNHFSAMAGLGPAQFARLFKRSTNVTLHQYIILRRIERARALLEETDLPIVEIAQECGFSDQVHLSRFFSRIVGTSPASFRRKARNRLSGQLHSL